MSTAVIRQAVSVTPSDTVDLDRVTTAVYVGGAGDLIVILARDSAAVTFKAVPAGTTLNIAAKRIKLSGASFILALYS